MLLKMHLLQLSCIQHLFNIYCPLWARAGEVLPIKIRKDVLPHFVVHAIICNKSCSAL